MIWHKMKSKSFKPLVIALTIIISIFIITSITKHLGYGLTYQVSISMPKGFYLIVPAKHIKRNDVVIFYPPPKIKTFLVQHKWIPNSAIMMKHVIGMPGDMVCKKNNALFVNNKYFGPVLTYYAPHKKLPNEPFCGKLKKQEYLLLSARIKRSFDCRYFGPVKRQQIIGKVIKL